MARGRLQVYESASCILESVAFSSPSRVRRFSSSNCFRRPVHGPCLSALRTRSIWKPRAPLGGFRHLDRWRRIAPVTGELFGIGLPSENAELVIEGLTP